MNENLKIQGEKKGVSSGIVFLLVIVFSAIFGVGGWFLGTKLANVEDKNQTKEPAPVEDNVEKVVPEKNTKYTFAKEVNTDLTFGLHIVDVYAYYYVDKESVKDSEDKTSEVFVLRREVYLHDKLIGDVHMLGHYNSQSDAEAEVSKYPLKEYVALKDTKNEKYYNIIDIDIVETIYDGTFNQVDADYKKAYLVDENGNILKEFKSTFHGTDVIGVFADDKMITGRFYSPIDKNPEFEYPDGKDYYLYPNNRLIDAYEGHIYYFAEGEQCSYVEKKLIVEDGKVIESLIQTFNYDDLDLAGQTC